MAPETSRRHPGRTVIDRKHTNEPDDTKNHGNAPKAHERTRRPPRRSEKERTHTNEPDDLRGARERNERTIRHQSAREWTQRTLRSPGRTGIDRAQPKEAGVDVNGSNVLKDPQGARELAKSTRKKTYDPQGARESTVRKLTNTTTPRAHGNGPNSHERTGRPPGRKGTHQTHTKEPKDLQGARELTECSRTNSNIPSAHGNQPKRTLRRQGSAGMDRTHTNESDNPQGEREWTVRNRTKATTTRVQTERTLQDAWEWTERTLRLPERSEMGRTHPNEHDDTQGVRECTQGTQRPLGRTGMY